MILMRHAETVFNVVFGATRQDPGIEDPPLTPRGRDQARIAAGELKSEGDVRRIITSPYSRALETAEILSKALELPVSVDPLVRERMKFACDIGSPRSALRQRWPAFGFDTIDEVWWSHTEEAGDTLHTRARAFCTAMAGLPDWSKTIVITHWGVVRSLTGERIQNCERIRIDPTRAGALVPPFDP
ncbi:MAG: histidine phosphatase family protein [Alphaproteobacteria bacterium]